MSNHVGDICLLSRRMISYHVVLFLGVLVSTGGVGEWELTLIRDCEV